ncbi:MAG: hypothetical protein NTY23_11170 [Chloroflexi bacterium]|jgi:hypothetical protein|nr:hypothetical protein [Chloroflexota bacterium]
MQLMHLPGGRPSEPRLGTTPKVAPAGSADPPLLVQLLNDEPGLRFFAAQFLHFSEPLLSAWVSDGVLTRWLAWLDEERGAAGEVPSASRPVGPTS